MATGFYLPDGRDFSSVFTAGNAGLNTGFKTANGTDIGNQFVAGNSGIATNYIPIGGGDLGSKLGVTKSYSQVLINEAVSTTKTFNINKYVSSIEYSGIIQSLISTSYMEIFIDNDKVAKVIEESVKSLAVNKYVSTIEVAQSDPDADHRNYIKYLKIYGSYI